MNIAVAVDKEPQSLSETSRGSQFAVVLQNRLLFAVTIAAAETSQRKSVCMRAMQQSCC